MRSKIIGIAGGSGSGKTTLCRWIEQELGDRCVMISSDDYYHAHADLTPKQRAALNFDHPASLELPLLAQHLVTLQQGHRVSVPQYCFKTHTRQSHVREIEPRPIILVEGVLIFSEPTLRAPMDLRIFVHADESVRFARRLSRDVQQRQRSKESVTRQWEDTVEPMYAQHVAPTQKFAHVVINANEPNEGALDLLMHGFVSSAGIAKP